MRVTFTSQDLDEKLRQILRTQGLDVQSDMLWKEGQDGLPEVTMDIRVMSASERDADVPEVPVVSLDDESVNRIIGVFLSRAPVVSTFVPPKPVQGTISEGEIKSLLSASSRLANADDPIGKTHRQVESESNYLANPIGSTVVRGDRPRINGESDEFPED